MEDNIKNHKLGFLISFNTSNKQHEVAKIDNPLDFAAEMEYDFIIPTLLSDDHAKTIAIRKGYTFTDETHLYKVTGKLIIKTNDYGK
jgi:hypothetical protein